MRREDRQIRDRAVIRRIMDACTMCTLALSGEEYPYAVPVNFGSCWEEETVTLYFHGAPEGTKIERMKRDSRAAFSMAWEGAVTLTAPACGSTMRYASVCGVGRLSLVNDPQEKRRGLAAIMRQYERAGLAPGRTGTAARKDAAEEADAQDAAERMAVQDTAERMAAQAVADERAAGGTEYDFSAAWGKTAVLRLQVEAITGKSNVPQDGSAGWPLSSAR